jgi:hypothetical protein
MIILSVSNGRAIVADIMRQGTEYEGDLGRYLEPIRALPFVRALDWTVAPRGTGDREIDAEIKITTPRRKFKLAAEFKRTYMDRATLNALIAQQAHVRQRLKQPLLLIARYIPTLMAERQAETGINFVDGVGNLHVNLGGEYYIFAVGRKEIKPTVAERRTTAAMVQTAFAVPNGRQRCPLAGAEVGRSGGDRQDGGGGGATAIDRNGCAARDAHRAADRRPESTRRGFPRRV